ncbi:ATP-binding protein [Spirillospora sp. NPDC127200]
MTQTTENEVMVMFSLVIETDPERLHFARQWVADVFDAWEIDSYVACLALSELMANVAKHTMCHKAVVRLYMCDAGPVVEVEDACPDLPAIREPDLTSEGGRGLAILQALTKRIGWNACGQGKVVYVIL